MQQSEHNEVPLVGGRLTLGIVRVGDTVRRPSGAGSRLMAELLTRVRTVGFEALPRYLGQDAHGRDILEYLEGWVPIHFQYFGDVQVARAGALMRAFHQATRDSGLASAPQVLCHHDAGPNNFVFRAGEPVGLIDFDMLACGEIREELGHMAWTWCVSSRPDRGPPARQAAQVRVLADGYGCSAEQRAELFDAMIARQVQNASFWRARQPDALSSAEQIESRIVWSDAERAFAQQHRAVFEAALR